jgi:amidohydrolase
MTRPIRLACAFTLLIGLTTIGVWVWRARAYSGAEMDPQRSAGPDPVAGKEITLKSRKHDIITRIDKDYARLDALYKQIHANPELSLEEEKTAARLAIELKVAGFEVTPKVGGHGVVAVLRNGKGPTVLVRADMDALPIEEKTGLAYASKVRVRDQHGRDVGAMHACGHDINVACLAGMARVLAGMKDQWRGTLVFIGQPAEEMGAGARLMLADGLFKRFPRPDYCLALHCDGRYPHGHVNYREGQMQANVDSVDITVKGKGGHGAAPHTTNDPIVLAARIVLDLQTIVSREVSPLESAVVTVGSIHGGTKHNIIPDEVKLQITVRTTNDAARKQVLEAIARLAKAAATGARAPEPIVTVNLDDFTPALVNDAKLTQRMVGLFQRVIGTDKVHERPMSMGGEDFSRFVREGIPGFYYHLGTADPERVAAARRGGPPLAVVHSAEYFPVPEPTIKTGVLTMSMAVLELVGK